MTVAEAYETAIGMLRDLPDYEKTSTQEFAEQFIHQDRIVELWNAAGNPQRAFPSIIAAGSNGKGSISAMLASILHGAGYRVGLWTKPHFHTHRERIRVGMEMIEPDAFVDVFRAVEGFAARTSLEVCSRYEFMVTMALEYFRRRGVDVAVLEGGAGGYIDLLSAIEGTAVAYGTVTMEHADLLGDTIAEIAREKSGLIKPGCPVVSEAQVPEAIAELRAAAAERSSPFYEVGRDIVVRGVPDDPDPSHRTVVLEYRHPDLLAEVEVPEQVVRLSLRGRYQRQNAGAAVASAILFGRGRRPVPAQAIEDGLAAVDWPARLELVDWNGVPVLMDSAHNAAKVDTLVSALEEDFQYRSVVAVIGISSDKDAVQILRSIGKVARVVVLTQSTHPRRTPVQDLERIAGELGVRCEAHPRVEDAVRRARALMVPGDLLCISGSMFVVMEARVVIGVVAESERSW